jgi:hypothetical protein
MRLNKKTIRILSGIGILIFVALWIFDAQNRIDYAISIALLTACFFVIGKMDKIPD